jgi:hypothetical protein
MKPLLIVAILATPVSASAQDRMAIAFGGGGIFDTSPAPARQFAEPLAFVAIQRVMLKYLVLEGDLNFWAHTDRSEIGPHDVSGPSVTGHVDHTTIIDERKVWTLGLNVLVRSTGAVRVFGGVGGGLITQDTVYSQTQTGCTGFVCTSYVFPKVRGPLPQVRLIGGVEVPVADRWAIIGSVRAEANDLEDHNNTVSAFTGVRFSIK